MRFESSSDTEHFVQETPLRQERNQTTFGSMPEHNDISAALDSRHDAEQVLWSYDAVWVMAVVALDHEPFSSASNNTVDN